MASDGVAGGVRWEELHSKSQMLLPDDILRFGVGTDGSGQLSYTFQMVRLVV